MNTRIFLLAAAVLAFLQGTILPPVFLAGPLLLGFLLAEPQNLYPLVFLAGLIFDLIQPAVFGINALLFLLFVFLVDRFSQKIPLRRPLVLLILVVGFSLVRAKMIGTAISPLAILLAVAVTIFLFWEKEGKLKL